MVEDDVFIRDCSTRRQQFADGPSDAAHMEITPGIIIFSNHQNPRMSSAHCSDKIVQVLEIVIIVTQENAVLACGMSEMYGIIFTGDPHIRWPLNVVTGLTQQASQE
jgi:hypothetical protein